jgi:Dolichyl-phosphate-mannose-protein mannosyltransferase
VSSRDPTAVRRRGFVVVGALVTTIAKLRLAATTAGTDDIGRWRDFAASVHGLGPIGIYSARLPVPFNHPPLIGWFLVAVNAISSHGPSLRFLIRVPASVADAVTAVLVFEFVRLRRSLNEATAAAVVIAISPVMYVISGFHGNTDPVFVMFILLSAYLIVKDRPFWAGASAAIAISIKLVPIVALPVIAVAVWQNRRRLIASTIGFLAVVLPVWGAVVLREWSGFKRNVLEYKGLHPADGRWGIVDFARHTGGAGLVDFLVGPGRFVALAISALVPAYLVLRRRDAVATGVGLSLALFLLLTTNFGTQYLAWAAAAVLLLDLWAGSAYNLSAGILLVVIYTHWAHGFPWYQAVSKQLTPSEEHMGWLVWTVLFGAVILGIRRLWRWPDRFDAVFTSANLRDRYRQGSAPTGHRAPG